MAPADLAGGLTGGSIYPPQGTSRHSRAALLKPWSQNRAMPPLLAWGLPKAELCFPSQAGLSNKKGNSCPSNRNLPRSGLCLPPQTGSPGGRAVAEGALTPHLLRKVRLRIEESICSLCCRSSFCSSSRRCSRRCTCTAWGGRGSPTPPGL